MKFVVRFIAAGGTNDRVVGTHRVTALAVKVIDGAYMFHDGAPDCPVAIFPVRHYYVERG